MHHAASLDWFRSRRARPWATTPVTEAGFVRVSSNAAAIAAAVSPADALAQLARMRGVAGHQFLADDIPLVVGDHLPAIRMVSHRQVTDAHLLALARRHGARLATFDRALAALAADAGREHVVLVPFNRSLRGSI